MVWLLVSVFHRLVAASAASIPGDNTISDERKQDCESTSSRIEVDRGEHQSRLQANTIRLHHCTKEANGPQRRQVAEQSYISEIIVLEIY